MAHLEATHELHTLDMLSLGTCVSGACEWTKSGGEDKVGASDIVVIACVRVVSYGRLVHQGRCHK